MIELALILPLVLIMIVGILDFGRAYVVGVGVQQGVREAARFGSNQALAPAAATDTQIVQRLIDASMPALQVCTTTGLNVSQTTSTLTNASCGFGTWSFTVACTVPSGSSASCSPQRTSGAMLRVTANGTVPLMLGFLTGYAGITDIKIQGDAAFPLL